jgi:8-oxo-dGTP pyrophosphatase MutT (NUDIX family)
MRATECPAPVEYACALPIRGRQILLGLRAPHRRNRPSSWDTIGGHIEPGETAEQALIRELREEIGIRPTTFAHLTTIRTTESEGTTPALWHLFSVTGWDQGEPAIANDEHSEIRWFDFADARALSPLASEAYRPVFAGLAAIFEAAS